MWNQPAIVLLMGKHVVRQACGMSWSMHTMKQKAISRGRDICADRNPPGGPGGPGGPAGFGAPEESAFSISVGMVGISPSIPSFWPFVVSLTTDLGCGITSGNMPLVDFISGVDLGL